MRACLASAVCVAASVILAALPTRADGTYPARTVTFICPLPAGGGTDLLTGMLARELQDKLRRPVVVENRPGAGTQVAAAAVAKSAPDGYTCCSRR